MVNLFQKTLKQQKGALMMEVLVSLFFVVTVFMGQLATQVYMQKGTVEAAQRTHAVSVLNNMVDRIKSNRGAIGCYDITGPDGRAPFIGSGGSLPGACGGFGDAETQLVAANDLAAWNAMLLGSTGINSSGAQIQNLKNAKGCISFNNLTDPPTITVAIAWEGGTEQAPSLFNCGEGAFGSEALRRVVQTEIQFGSLS